jgi:hypothetical protein
MLKQLAFAFPVGPSRIAHMSWVPALERPGYSLSTVPQINIISLLGLYITRSQFAAKPQIPVVLIWTKLKRLWVFVVGLGPGYGLGNK